MVRCENPDCIEASRELKNKRISEGNLRALETGRKTTRKDGWDNVALVSKEELLLTPWFKSLGWIPQYKFLTGVHTNKLPRMFRLDFALPERNLYVEIDGSVHRNRDRKLRDARRNKMMTERGWIGLRVTNDQVTSNPDATKQLIAAWISEHL